MPKQFNKARLRGITLVELFAALGILAVVLSFASTPLERMSARVDVDIAHGNISEMLEVAQRAAAKHELPVVISVSKKLGRTHLEASYSYRWRNLRLSYIPSYSLPPKVDVVLENGATSIELDRDGAVQHAQIIRLFSRMNPDYVAGISLTPPERE